MAAAEAEANPSKQAKKTRERTQGRAHFFCLLPSRLPPVTRASRRHRPRCVQDLSQPVSGSFRLFFWSPSPSSITMSASVGDAPASGAVAGSETAAAAAG